MEPVDCEKCKKRKAFVYAYGKWVCGDCLVEAYQKINKEFWKDA